MMGLRLLHLLLVRMIGSLLMLRSMLLLRLSGETRSWGSFLLLWLLKMTPKMLLLMLMLQGRQSGWGYKNLVKRPIDTPNGSCGGRGRMVNHNNSRIHMRALHVDLRLLQEVNGRLLGGGRDK